MRRESCVWRKQEKARDASRTTPDKQGGGSMDWRDPVIVWLVVAVLFFVIEIVTPTIFMFACLGVGAIAAAVILKFGGSYWLSWFSFITVGLLGILISRPLAERFTGSSARLAHVDDIIGKQGKVLKTIDPQTGMGLVKLGNEEWRAEAEERVEEGAMVEVVAVEGVHLKVKKV